MGVLFLSAGLIIEQPDMGTAMVLSCIAFGILFMSGVPLAPLTKVLVGFGLVAVVFGLSDPYRRDRILSFVNPGAHQAGSGYQVWQSLVGLGSGHLFGLGLGAAARSGGRSRTPTPTSSSRWWGKSWAWSGPSCPASLLRTGLVRVPGSRAGPRPLRLAAGRGRDDLDRQSGDHQHRRRDRRPAGDRHPSPFISFGGSSLVITLAAVGSF